MTNKKIATNVAKKLIEYLSEKGIETECDFQYKSIDETLRSSWYVSKVKEVGHTDCIHVDVKCGGFFAILESGEIMTGANVMISDAITSIIYELFGEPNYDTLMANLNVYTEEDYEEDVLLIGTLDKIEFLINKFDNSYEYKF